LIIKRFIAILAGLWLFPWLAGAQEYSYVNYNIKDGLAGSVVYCMVQDHDGFIWFGTETGLSRFDGSRFVNYTTNDGLPDNEIIRLFVDSKNRVWITPFKNRICYYQHGKIHTQENDSLLSRIPIQDNVISIVENSKGDVLITENHGIHTIHADHRITTMREFVSYDRGVGPAGLFFDGGFAILMGFPDDKFYLMKFAGDSLAIEEDMSDYRRHAVPLVYLGRNLKVLNKSDSLEIITPAKEFHIAAPSGAINICPLNDSLVAVTSSSKTFTYNYIRGVEDRVFFTGKNITSVMEDREGNLWFSGMGSGVYRLPSTRFISSTFEFEGNKLAVYSLQKKGDTLFAGTDHYLLWEVDTRNNQERRTKVVPELSQGRITVIDTLSNGKIVVGTDMGLYQQTDRNGYKQIFTGGAIKSIFIYKDSFILATSNGTYYDYRLKSSDPRAWFQMRSTAVYRQSNLIFFGTLNGLYAKNENGQATQLGNIHPAFNSRISALEESPDGTLWIGTYGSGVVGYKNGKITVILTKDSGLTSNIARALYVTGNAVWIGTDKGLNKVELKNGSYKITRYTSADGLMSDMINTVHVEGNTVYAGTPVGITRFEEDGIYTNSMCLLRLTDIRSERQPSVSDTSRLNFDHYDTDIRFEFTGISFKSAGEITYWHRLKGLDTAWHASRENFINYPTLPSGNYELELQAENKFGVRSEIMRLRFSIEYLLWEMTWFRVASVILFAAILWIFISYRIRKIRKQEQEKLDTNQKLAELEQMALRAQMNPHFIFNSLNSIQHYVFGKDIQGANRFITEFSRLIRMTMEISTKEKISLEDEIKYLSTYLELEKKRFENKFVYNIYVEESVDPALCYVPPMLLQPYIENSIRHGIRYLEGNDGMVKLGFSIAEGYLVCSVEDNGIGRKKSKELKGQTIIEYQSQGMTLTARRIDLMNINFNNPILIEISDIYAGNEAAGTKVLIRIPMHEILKPLSSHDKSGPY
jgi:ligand-binding sensor domain-containing protein